MLKITQEEEDLKNQFSNKLESFLGKLLDQAKSQVFYLEDKAISNQEKDEINKFVQSLIIEKFKDCSSKDFP